MVGEASEFFTELLFGSGAWLGLILIIAIMLLVSAKTKTGGIFMCIISIFLGLEYFNNVSTSSNFMWSAIIMFITGALLAIQSGYRVVKD